MSEQTLEGNAPNMNYAMTETMRLGMDALDRATNRSAHLPGIVALYGPSGVGKSSAASLAANQFGAYYVEMRSAWTKKGFLEHVLKDMGIKASSTLCGMLEQICEELMLSHRPLIIDEFDYAVEKNMIELVRDIYEGSNAAILLIGEEHLSTKMLRRSERFHNRMLHWARADFATSNDAYKLRDFYCRDVNVADDLVEYIRKTVGGCVRRLCVNLENVSQESKRQGWGQVNRADWGARPLYTGTPAPRSRGAKV